MHYSLKREIQNQKNHQESTKINKIKMTSKGNQRVSTPSNFHYFKMIETFFKNELWKIVLSLFSGLMQVL
jgi:hypothetical protein